MVGRMIRGLLSSLVELVGAGLVVAGAWLWDWRAGLAVLGLVLVLAGYVIDSAPARRDA